MDSIPAGATQSWFFVKVAVALCPILTFWGAGVIGWFLRCTLWRRSGVAPQSGGEPAAPRCSPVSVTGRPGRLADRLGPQGQRK